MRSFVLVIFSAIGLAGLFMAYWVMQPGSSAPGALTRDDRLPPLPKKDAPSFDHIHETDNAWVLQYDKQGQLSSAFKGDHYQPKPDGTVDVTNPAAKFMLANHQHLEIIGTTGNIVLKATGAGGSGGLMSPGPAAPPNRGRLDNVVVNLVDETRPRNEQNVLTMTTNNVVFDNETFRISTEGYRDSQGRLIADDQVPVHVTGQIEMEGRGLSVRWNDRDGRLELLEIAHGDVLKITDPSQISLLGGPKKPRSRPQPSAMRPNAPLPVMLAAKGRAAEGEVVTSFQRPQTQPRRDQAQRAAHGSNPPLVYLASFYDNVKVTQPDPSGAGDQVVIDNVDRMDVNFILKQSTSSPATQPTTAPAPAVTSVPSGAAAETQQPKAAASAPTTKPAEKEQPVFVHWTGVLRITPLQTSPPVPLKPGDAAVTLVGAPVQIHRVEPRQQGTDDIRCASVLYLTAGEKVWLGHSDQFPEILITKFPPKKARDPSPTRLVSSGIVQYAGGEDRAIVTGPGQGEIPLEASGPGQHPLLQAAWMKGAEFDFTQGPADKQAVLHYGHFEGDVDIRHPRMALRSQSLDLLFDPSMTPAVAQTAGATAKKGQSQADLRQAIATTGVWCQLQDSNGKKQTIKSNRLVLDTDVANGKIYPRHVNATGSVHAYGEDDLKARYLDLWLAPSKTATPAKAGSRQASDGFETAQTELERMVARDQVVAKSKDGSVASGDELLVTTVNGKQRTILSSRSQARVTDAKGNVVAGPEIHFDNSDGRARVIGPGSLHAVQQASTTQPARPVDVNWATGAEFDGAANRIDAFGSVMATSIDAKGFVDEAVGDHILIELRKKPAPPSTQPIQAAAHQPASKKGAAGDLGGANMDLFKDKEVVALTLEKNAVLKSTLRNSQGQIEQQSMLEGPTIIIRQMAPDGTPGQSVTVPAAGKMLVRDHRPQQPKQSASSSSDDQSGGRGATAFEWRRSLVYSELTRRADMVGQVVVVHQDQDPRQPPVQLDAEHVIAWFEPAAPRKAGPKPKNSKNDDQSPLQLKHLTAQAGAQPVVVTRDIEQMIARQVDYDPRQQVLTATGAPVVFHSGPTQQTMADRIDWDTTNWNPQFTNAIIDYHPPTPGVQQPKTAKGAPDPNKLSRRSNQP